MELHNNNKIAILLAVYNGEKYLGEQIDSVIEQTNQEWTLYIRDDNSKDSTREIIESYTSRYDNIIEVKDTKGNLGCRYNFFELLEVVESEYYMFCDADDVWFPNKIALTFERLKRLETDQPCKPLVVHTDYAICDAQLNVIIPSCWRALRLDPSRFMTYNQFGVKPLVGGSLMMFNRRAKEISFPVVPESSMFDAWISLRVLKNGGSIASLPIPTSKYRQHENNFYGSDMKKNRSLRMKVIKSVRMNRKNMLFLKHAGWGGALKYLWFRSYLFFKVKYLQSVYRTVAQNEDRK